MVWMTGWETVNGIRGRRGDATERKTVHHHHHKNRTSFIIIRKSINGFESINFLYVERADGRLRDENTPAHLKVGQFHPFHSGRGPLADPAPFAASLTLIARPAVVRVG